MAFTSVLAAQKTVPLKPQWKQAKVNLIERPGESSEAGKSAEVTVVWPQGTKILKILYLKGGMGRNKGQKLTKFSKENGQKGYDN